MAELGSIAVAAIIGSLTKRIAGSDVSESLLGGLTDVVKAGGKSAAAELEDWFGAQRRRDILATIIEQSVDAAETAHPEAVNQCGRFPTGFFETEAADELARTFIVNEGPDAYELADVWATSVGLDKKRARFLAAAVPLCKGLTDSFVSRVRANDAFSAKVDRSIAQEGADAAQRLAAQAGAARATSTDRFNYLEEVLKRTRHLDTTGLGEVAEGGNLEIDKVYLPLRVVEQPRWRDRDSTEFDRELAKLIQEGQDPHEATDLALRNWRNQTESDLSARPVEGALADHTKLMLLGDPGSGKSTILQATARQIAASATLDIDAPIPIQLKAGDVIQANDWEDDRFLDFLVQQHRAASFPSADSLEDLFSDALERGRAVVLFDACDEIPELADRKMVVKRLGDFVARYEAKGNRFVASSRESGYYLAPLANFDHARVADLDPRTEIAPFARKYWESWTPPEANQDHDLIDTRVGDITEALQRPGFARVASNPLILTIMLGVQRRGGRLPHNRAEAYRKAIDHLESRRQDTNRRELRSRLIAMATWAHRHKETGVMSITDIARALVAPDTDDPTEFGPAELDDLEREVRSIVTAHGPLVEAAPQRWKFLHQTIQEFYVAEGLKKDNIVDTARALRRRLHDDRYREPILLTLGLIHHCDANPNIDTAALVEAVIYGTGDLADEGEPFAPSDYEELLRRDRDFALLAAADLLPVPVDRVISSGALGGIQNSALSGLDGSILGNELVAVLAKVASANNPDLPARSVAVLALGKLCAWSTRGVDHLTDLVADADADVRKAAASALRNSGDAERAAQVLADLLTDADADLQLRHAAAHSLGGLVADSEQAIQPLVEVVNDTTIDAHLRRIATLSLGGVAAGSEQALQTLTGLVSDTETEAHLRRAAASALGRLGQSELAVDVLCELVAEAGGADRSVRWSAAMSLGSLGAGEDRAIQALAEVATDTDTDTSLIWAAIWALDKLGAGSERATDACAEVVAQPDTEDYVRCKAASALGALGGVEPAIEALSKLMTDSGTAATDRRHAALSLGGLGAGSQQASEALAEVAAQADADALVRLTAASVLGGLGEIEPAVRVLGELTSDTALEMNLRRHAASYLGDLGEVERAVAVLRELADDNNSDASSRQGAARALDKLGALRPPYRDA